ncbi:MAG: hypothetical protein BRD57_05760, partial [Proteobacteria bacterium SW_6_67_9]
MDARVARRRLHRRGDEHGEPVAAILAVVPRLTVSARLGNAVAALVCFAAVGYAVAWLQLVQGLAPCPLCIVDRAAFAGAGLVFLLAAFHGPARWGRRLYAGAALVPLALGLASAGRHVWLQHLPT